MQCTVGGAVGKDGLNEYKQHGYVPYDAGGGDNAVSRSLDFGFADFATANAFRVFADLPEFSSLKSKLIDAQELENRAHRSYKSLFDSSSGLMYTKDKSGRARGRINPIEWGKG